MNQERFEGGRRLDEKWDHPSKYHECFKKFYEKRDKECKGFFGTLKKGAGLCNFTDVKAKNCTEEIVNILTEDHLRWQ